MFEAHLRKASLRVGWVGPLRFNTFADALVFKLMFENDEFEVAITEVADADA